MRIVIAFDKFKGTLSARAACLIFADAVSALRPDAEVIVLPVADGGEGTLDAMLSALGGKTEAVEVSGPLGSPAAASIARLSDGRAVVESAQACGLALLGGSFAPLRASTDGVGELIVKAAGGATEVVVGLGGSASTDGGTGAARAAGFLFLDARGKHLPPGGVGLVDLHRIVPPEEVPSRIVAACDVDNPLTGARGAARVFAPQKGASPTDVTLLEEGLSVLAERCRLDLGRDVELLPGAGAAGGLGAGLAAFLAADLRPGAELIVGAIGLDAALAGAQLVVSGEGRLDEGSLGGKAPVTVAQHAAAAGVPCALVAGSVAIDPATIGVARAVDLSTLVGEESSLADPGTALGLAARALLGDDDAGREPRGILTW